MENSSLDQHLRPACCLRLKRHDKSRAYPMRQHERVTLSSPQRSAGSTVASPANLVDDSARHAPQACQTTSVLLSSPSRERLASPGAGNILARPPACFCSNCCSELSYEFARGLRQSPPALFAASASAPHITGLRAPTSMGSLVIELKCGRPCFDFLTPGAPRGSPTSHAPGAGVHLVRPAKGSGTIPVDPG